MAENKSERSYGFKPGQSGNPGGRPKLSEHMKKMRTSALEKAVEIMNAKVHEKRFIDKMTPGELTSFLALIFDRCGLPKMTAISDANGDNLPVRFTLSLGDGARD